jgi:thiol-disulfide isomerase/thioredoxin
MKRLIAFVSVVMLFAVNGFALNENGTNGENLFQIKDTNGTTYNVEALSNGLQFKEFKDKVIFLEFFGHKCPPCMKSIPEYIELQERYREKLVIMAIEVQGLTTAQTAEFAKQKGINYITISQADADIFIEHIATQTNWSGAIPFLIILDQKGEVQTMQAGLIPKSALENVIETLTKDKTETLTKDDNNESNATKK